VIETLTTIEMDILAAVPDPADAVGAPSEPMARQKRVTYNPPTGVLHPSTINQTLVNLPPDNTIVVDEG
jgi:hypothetical protein